MVSLFSPFSVLLEGEWPQFVEELQHVQFYSFLWRNPVLKQAGDSSPGAVCVVQSANC